VAIGGLLVVAGVVSGMLVSVGFLFADLERQAREQVQLEVHGAVSIVTKGHAGTIPKRSLVFSFAYFGKQVNDVHKQPSFRAVRSPACAVYFEPLRGRSPEVVMQVKEQIGSEGMEAQGKKYKTSRLR
jgi:hypothetical protein